MTIMFGFFKGTQLLRPRRLSRQRRLKGADTFIFVTILRRIMLLAHSIDEAHERASALIIRIERVLVRGTNLGAFLKEFCANRLRETLNNSPDVGDNSATR